MTEDIVVPSLKAIILCDMVITDQVTRKMSAIGMFNEIMANKFPCRHHQMSIYCCMTDAFGTYSFDIELIAVETLQVIGKTTIGPFEAPDRLAMGEFAVTLKNLVFPGPGKYEFRISTGRHFLQSKELQVTPIS